MPAATSNRLSSCLRPGKHSAIGSEVRGHPINATHHFGDIIDLLKTLIREPSVVGDEHAFFRVRQRDLEVRGLRRIMTPRAAGGAGYPVRPR